MSRVLETAMYMDDLELAARFYQEVIGLRTLTANDRIMAMDARGDTVFLLFQRGASAGGVDIPYGRIPPHNGSGPVHSAFAVEPSSLAEWRAHPERAGRPGRERGGRSLYFRDPDGHSVELATPGTWDVY